MDHLGYFKWVSSDSSYGLSVHSQPLHHRKALESNKMKSLIYNGVGKYEVVDKDMPKIEDGTDAIVKLVRTTICGTDLHILKGDVPTVDKGRTLGHEGIGIIHEAGGELKHFKKGDRVVIRCITCCGTCQFCKRKYVAGERSGKGAIR